MTVFTISFSYYFLLSLLLPFVSLLGLATSQAGTKVKVSFHKWCFSVYLFNNIIPQQIQSCCLSFCEQNQSDGVVLKLEVSLGQVRFWNERFASFLVCDDNGALSWSSNAGDESVFEVREAHSREETKKVTTCFTNYIVSTFTNELVPGLNRKWSQFCSLHYLKIRMTPHSEYFTRGDGTFLMDFAQVWIQFVKKMRVLLFLLKKKL